MVAPRSSADVGFNKARCDRRLITILSERNNRFHCRRVIVGAGLNLGAFALWTGRYIHIHDDLERVELAVRRHNLLPALDVVTTVLPSDLGRWGLKLKAFLPIATDSKGKSQELSKPTFFPKTKDTMAGASTSVLMPPLRPNTSSLPESIRTRYSGKPPSCAPATETPAGLATSTFTRHQSPS